MTWDGTKELAERVRAAHAAGTPLRIAAGGTKAWLGRPVAGEVLDVAGHRGIVGYEPSELTLTARAGTPLAEIEATLAEHGQCLPFEPPHYGEAATLGGTVACNLSGPARPYTGACRDFVLGARIVNGRGTVLRFGGEVMKNVAGYDLSRLMAGAQGTLGVILDVSLKVLPRPAAELTLVLEMDAAAAVACFNAWAARPLPITAACHVGERAYVRLAGAEAAVRAARLKLGGEALADGAAFWRSVREHGHGFFSAPGSLWRLSLPPAAPVNPGLHQFIDWGGAQRWVYSEQPLWASAAAAGGHATRWRAGSHASSSPMAAGEVFQPLPDGLLALHRRLKWSFDPTGILNPGRLYPEL
ncbi:MAG: glycolate oxidase subunit GlcE [Thiobacillaceae bacterium]